MRWSAYVEPKAGDRRTRKKFLFLPLTIGRETRWLEIASWSEEWKEINYIEFYTSGFPYNKFRTFWEPVEWL